MLLIVEIILAIFAWRKGWRWYSLIPMVVALVFGFFLGAGIAASGGNVDSIRGLGVIIDILATIILIVMNIKTPNSVKNK
jgi:hypothetical protein